MARRHVSLIPLTHDHHHAVAQARRLEDAAALTEERPIGEELEDLAILDRRDV